MAGSADAALLLEEDRELRAQNTALRRQLVEAAQRQFPLSHSTVTWIAMLGGCILLTCIYVAYKLVVLTEDKDGDGDVDLSDVQEQFRETFLCGMSWHGVKNMVFLLLFAVGGFCLLWSKGFIQPFLKQMTVYLYLAMVLIGIVAVMVFEVWNDISNVQRQIMKFIHKVNHMFDQGVEDLEEEIEVLQDVVCCRSSPKPKAKAKAAPGRP